MTALTCSPREALLFSAFSAPADSSVTRSRVNRNCRRIVSAVKIATPSMATNQRCWFSFSAIETSVGKIIEPTPITPRLAMFVSEASVERCLLLRVETGTSVELAVL